jgi:hypothetical protein
MIVRRYEWGTARILMLDQEGLAEAGHNSAELNDAIGYGPHFGSGNAGDILAQVKAAPGLAEELVSKAS